MSRTSLFIIFLVLQLNHLASCQSVKAPNVLMSDGLDDNFISQSSSLQQVVDVNLKADTLSCVRAYGFVPCSDTAWGLSLTAILYWFLIFAASHMITSGSELFFSIYGTRTVGPSIFHFLGLLPQALIVFFTGILATAETAEAMATMNIAMVAGSGIGILTLEWGLVVLFGRSSNCEAQDDCAETDMETMYTARGMIVSVIPYIILQFTKHFSSTSGTRTVILVSLIVSTVLIFIYVFYQLFQPWIWSRRGQLLRIRYVDSREGNFTNCLGFSGLLIVGIGSTVFLATPFMVTLQDLFTALHIPSFYSSYVLIPFAIHLLPALQAISSVRKTSGPKLNVISLTLSEIYNSVFLNNLIGLTIFLALVYFRNLSWDVGAAAMTVLVICLIMGIFTSCMTRFPSWTYICAIIMYFFSILLIFILTFFLGWT